ncbi:MAG TPA: hypothetical protein VI636_16065 [Candidatus Angelobacter sp.]
MAAQAQRGMGFHGSSAPTARAGSGFAARPMPAGRMAPVGVRSMPAARFMSPRGRAFIPGQRSFAFQSRGFRTFPHRFRNRNRVFFGSTCFNTFGRAFPCANPFLFSGIGYPGDPFYAGYYSQSEPQPIIEEQDNNNGGNRELAVEVQELSDEIQSMRDEDRAREERRNAGARPAAQDDGPNATLVFRDGLQLSVKNYAISGDTIWVLDEHSHQKVPLSRIDIAATQKINDQNGVEFRLPRQ